MRSPACRTSRPAPSAAAPSCIPPASASQAWRGCPEHPATSGARSPSPSLFGYGMFFKAGLLMILANIFDMFDGQVARLRGRVTRFGAFFDSVIDRYSDVIVFVGIMVFYARNTERHSTLLVALTGLALVGSVMISYSRARAESLDIACKVGFLERPERVVLLIIASLTEVGSFSNPFLHKMPQVLWVLAVLSHWTVVHRIYHTWRELRETDR